MCGWSLCINPANLELTPQVIEERSSVRQGIETVQDIREIIRHVHPGFSLVNEGLMARKSNSNRFCADTLAAFSRQNVPKGSTGEKSRLLAPLLRTKKIDVQA
jgi:hypothetical protein